MFIMGLNIVRPFFKLLEILDIFRRLLLVPRILVVPVLDVDQPPITVSRATDVFKKKVKQSRYTPWRRLVGEEYSSYSFTTSALDGGEWSASRPGRPFTPGERTPGTHWTGGWVSPRASLDTGDRRKILCPCRGSNPDHPVVQPVVRH
jgi:hypothetical protein